MIQNLINRRVVLASRPKGVPSADHFAVEDEVPVPELAEGQFLIRMLYWSVDPAMRGWTNDAPNYLPPVAIGATMRSLAVGEVIASRTPAYEEGQVVSGMFGWQRYAISDGGDVDRIVADQGLSPSLALGVLGLNGLTAYFGLLDICRPKEGETVVVSTAAGSVGSAVGQIARISGCRTVGITSTEEKMALCRERFGYDVALSYRDDDLHGALGIACPDGVDCYFDNTCGEITDSVMCQLAVGARIAICGTTALTDWDPIPLGPRVHRQLLVARARLQGFVIFDFRDRYAEALGRLAGWVRDGRLDCEEHVLDGADAARGAIEMLYAGQNRGKLLVRPD